MATNNNINAQFPVNVSNKGTGATSFTAYSPICGGTTSTGALQSVASVGTAGQVLTYQGASALPSFAAAPTAGDWVKITSGTASNSATLDFFNLTTSYSAYVFEIIQIIPVSSGQDFNCRISINNSTFLTGLYSGASYNKTWATSGGTSTSTFIPASTISMAQSLATTANYGLSGTVMLYPSSASGAFNFITWQLSYRTSVVADTYYTNIGGANNGASAGTSFQGMRFYMGSGNISSGKINVYGLNA